ncbi:MAG: hypothetical protein ACM31L_09475 [Actinomycetota bacterium]
MNKVVLLLCCCVPSLAWADLLPPVHYELQERMKNDPQAYDRADQFCANKKVGSACAVPGNPFEGGGVGTCQTRADDKQRTIDSLCIFGDRREVLRNLPDRGYKGADEVCDMARRNPHSEAAADVRAEKLTCDQAATVPDRFCDGKAAGDPCAAEMSVAGSILSFPGRCGEKEERATYYSRGRQIKTRTVLICLPENPTVIEVGPSSPPGWLQRLLD